MERVVRFGEGTFVIGTCKKPAWTLMMSCGTWNERESECVLSMRVVGFLSGGGCHTIPATGTLEVPVGCAWTVLLETIRVAPMGLGDPWGPCPLQVMVFSEH